MCHVLSTSSAVSSTTHLTYRGTCTGPPAGGLSLSLSHTHTHTLTHSQSGQREGDRNTHTFTHPHTNKTHSFANTHTHTHTHQLVAADCFSEPLMEGGTTTTSPDLSPSSQTALSLLDSSPLPLFYSDPPRVLRELSTILSNLPLVL